MGSGLEASCPCGYELPLFAAGAGFADHEATCCAPACCATCRKVVGANYLDEAPPRCPDCLELITFYDDKALSAVPKREPDQIAEVFSWGSFRLLDLPYRCPACGQFRLRFKPSGLIWD